ncbi:MAG: HAMP domain-containing histidine kinase [Bacteroidetes bacterium]|nr:HAMP domain-containing histidine kinase [Bacteroidota bacterium]
MFTKKRLEEEATKMVLNSTCFFPARSNSSSEEMGTLFITSVLLILIVLIMFWRTILSLINEKRISEHTTDFLNNMTHEFKTPLTNIALAGKMIRKDVGTGQEEKIKHYSGIILQENEKLRLQVEQVLSMTALERGEIPLRKTELDFHELISDALKSMSLQLENAKGEIDLALNAEKVVVFGDKTHLTNAMCNLIDNAIKYAKEIPTIRIQTTNEGDDLVVVFSDSGIGIDKDFHKKVFDKFFRVPTGDVHNVKGFGLGLAYIKKIIELHGGRIEIQSEKDKGTSFRFTLPNV